MSDKAEPASTSAKDWLKKGKIAESHINVCLRGDLYGDIQILDEELRELQKNIPENATLAARAEPRRLAERIEALREQMREATKTFKLRALGDRAWDALTAAHPPRPGNETDARHEVNVDTFYPELIQKSVYEPDLDPEDWEQLAILLTKGQRLELQNTAVGLNKDTVNIPFSSAASKAMKASAPA